MASTNSSRTEIGIISKALPISSHNGPKEGLDPGYTSQKGTPLVRCSITKTLPYTFFFFVFFTVLA